MKKKISLILFLIISIHIHSQSYMDKIATETCECLEKIPDSIKGEQFNIKLGFCMIEASTPYKKKLKKDYKIDLGNIDEQGEELGELVGMKMLGFCPNALMKISDRNDVQEEIVQNQEFKTIGRITNIEEKQFIVFSLKDSTGKTNKFYWMSYIESDMDIFSDYKELKNESVKITYFINEFFDSRIGEYRDFNIITKIEKARQRSSSLIGQL